MKKFKFSKVSAQIIGSVLAVFAAFLAGGILMAATGTNPFAVYARLLDGILLNPYGIAQMFFKATPLIFTGLSVALAFKAGLFNIGGEGQMVMGAFMAALAGAYIPAPPALHLPICLLAAFAGGMIWALVPALLKVKTGAHEVITTIMMNFIAEAVANYFVTTRFHEPETVHTAPIAASAYLPRLEILSRVFHGSPANAAFLIALALCLGVAWSLWKTPLGYELRAVGLNPGAAATAGIGVGKSMLTAFLISGGLAGLAGTNFILGYKHYFEEGFSGGAGFMGIAVALLGQNNPAGIVLASFLMGGLSHGSLVINALVPKDVVLVLQALVIVFVMISNEMVRRRIAHE